MSNRERRKFCEEKQKREMDCETAEHADHGAQRPQPRAERRPKPPVRNHRSGGRQRRRAGLSTALSLTTHRRRRRAGLEEPRGCDRHQRVGAAGGLAECRPTKWSCGVRRQRRRSAEGNATGAIYLRNATWSSCCYASPRDEIRRGRRPPVSWANGCM